MIIKSSRALLLVATAAAVCLGGCAKKAATPEERCSSASTYDQIIDLLASQIAQARISGAASEIVAAASSTQALKNIIKFELPTVVDANATTGKVSCQAMMRVTADSQAQQLIYTAGLDTNEVASDHLQLRIRFSLQPTADTGSSVLELEQASALATVAMGASVVAVQRIRNAAGTSAPIQNLDVQMNDSAAASPAGDEDAPAASTNGEVANGAPSPQATPPSDAGARDKARAFASEYFKHSSGDVDAALAWMAGHYADEVRFFGKNLDRSDILKQKVDYLRRWPERSYTIEPESVTVECKPGQTLCHVAGIIDWSASSSARGANAQGKAAFDLVVLSNGADQTIVAENSRVISRNP